MNAWLPPTYGPMFAMDAKSSLTIGAYDQLLDIIDGTDVFDGCTRVYVFGTANSPAETFCILEREWQEKEKTRKPLIHKGLRVELVM